MANRIHPTMERIRSAFFSSIMQTFVFIFFVFFHGKDNSSVLRNGDEYIKNVLQRQL